jgi:hypothetical protein
VWEQYLPNPDLHELADFAILLLGLVVNQGGNECDFSDFKIKKTRLRNRLNIKRVSEMSKVSFCPDNYFKKVVKIYSGWC